jgi:hypothetical protein
VPSLSVIPGLTGDLFGHKNRPISGRKAIVPCASQEKPLISGHRIVIPSFRIVILGLTGDLLNERCPVRPGMTLT